MPGSGMPKSGHPNRRTARDAQNGGPPPGKMLIFQCSEAATDRTDMAKSAEPVTIKKYANRRLYNTGTSTYVTLEDLASLVKKGEDFVVYDAKTGRRSPVRCSPRSFSSKRTRKARICCRSPSCAS